MAASMYVRCMAVVLQLQLCNLPCVNLPCVNLAYFPTVKGPLRTAYTTSVPLATTLQSTCDVGAYFALWVLQQHTSTFFEKSY